jgi:hypothetical protein
LVIVKVPPDSRRGGSCSLPRGPGEVGDLLLDLGEAQPLGVAQHGHDQSPRPLPMAMPMSK